MPRRPASRDRAMFYERDLFQTDVSPATVLTHLPAARREPHDTLAAAGDAQARHAHRLARLRHGRMAARSAARDGRAGQDGRHRREEQGVLLGRAGHRRGQMALAARSAKAGPRTTSSALDQNFQKLAGHARRRRAAGETGEPRADRRAILVQRGPGRAGVRYDFSGRIFNNAITGTARVRSEKPGGPAQELAWNATRTQIWDPRHVVEASQPAK